MQIKKPSKRNRLPLIITAGVVLVLIIGWMAYAFVAKTWPFTEALNETSETRDANTVNYDPPTQEEIDESQDAKKRSETTSNDTDSKQSPDSTSSPKSPKKTANVGISYADIYKGNLEIRAFTASVIEGTGTCTATVTMKGMESMRIVKTSEAFIDTSSTLCRPIYIPVSQLHSGTWQVVVVFSSPDYEGKSETVEVKVP